MSRHVNLRHFAGYFVGLLAAAAAFWIVAIPFRTEKVTQTLTAGKKNMEVEVEQAINALRAEALWGAIAPLVLVIAVLLAVWAATKATTTRQKVTSNIVAFVLGGLFVWWLVSTSALEGVNAEFAWRGFFASVVVVLGAIASWAFYRREDSRLMDPAPAPAATS